MTAVIGFLVMKVQCVSALPPCETCLTSHMLERAMSDVANIQSDPSPSKCTHVLVNTTSSVKKRDFCFINKNHELQITVTQ